MDGPLVKPPFASSSSSPIRAPPHDTPRHNTTQAGADHWARDLRGYLPVDCALVLGNGAAVQVLQVGTCAALRCGRMLRGWMGGKVGPTWRLLDLLIYLLAY